MSVNLYQLPLVLNKCNLTVWYGSLVMSLSLSHPEPWDLS